MQYAGGNGDLGAEEGGSSWEICRWDGVMCVCVGVNGDKLAGESGVADLLIKIDVLPFCFKCN